MSRTVFDEIKKLVTEQRNPSTMDIDTKSALEIVQLINAEDHKVAPIVKEELPHIAQAVEIVVQAFKRGGRLIYVGAGTSGRLGVLDHRRRLWGSGAGRGGIRRSGRERRPGFEGAKPQR
jgi:N-acetylmuramic acid 6-phosphate etherase